jgi:hypothetical protein
MSEPFNYDVPSPDTLAGITVTFDDDPSACTLPVLPSNSPRSSPALPDAHPTIQDLAGITYTFDDDPSACLLPPSPPPPAP